MSYYKLREIKNYKLPVDATIQTQTIFDKLQDSTDIVNFIDATSDKIYSLVKDNAITESKLSEEVRTKLNAPSGVSSITSPNNTLNITNNQGNVSIDITSNQLLNTSNLEGKIESTSPIKSSINYTNDKIKFELEDGTIGENFFTESVVKKLNAPSDFSLSVNDTLIKTETEQGIELSVNLEEVFKAENIETYIPTESIDEKKLANDVRQALIDPPFVLGHVYNRPRGYLPNWPDKVINREVMGVNNIYIGKTNVAISNEMGGTTVRINDMALNGWFCSIKDDITSLEMPNNNFSVVDCSNLSKLTTLNLAGMTTLRAVLLPNTIIDIFYMSYTSPTLDVYSKMMSGEQQMSNSIYTPSKINLHLRAGSTFTLKGTQAVEINVIYDY